MTEGPMEADIRATLKTKFAPSTCEVLNESHMHSVPPNSETHFRLLLVSAQFAGQSRVQRSRVIHEALAVQLKNGVHALTFRAYDPVEWKARGENDDFASPNCHGGSKPR